MRDFTNSSKRLRITSVIASLTAGGIGPVCRYAAEGIAKLKDWQVTLLSLHDPVKEFTDEASGLKIVCLGLDGNCARHFLLWLAANPQDLIITSDVPCIEPSYRFIQPATRHVMQIHDSGRRYRNVAVRHAQWIDGVTCVGRHFEDRLRGELGKVNYGGLLRTIHNGAFYPEMSNRSIYSGPLRLLFMGRMDVLKGTFDLVPILSNLQKLGVTFNLNIVGGFDATLLGLFKQYCLESNVIWHGWISHDECFQIACQSDVFLMLSRKEPFGMVTIEAMGMGCVPIAYNVPSGSTEIIQDKKNGFLVPLGNFAAIARCIANLDSDRNRLSVLSQAAVTRARSGFNSKKMAVELELFISDVLAHAKLHPCFRDAGKMLKENLLKQTQVGGKYQLLPRLLRMWIRNRIAANPRLCYLYLNR